MAKRLRDNLTSDYFSAINSMRSKTARKRIVAYVESYDDVFFWRMVLREFEDDKHYFEVMLPSKVNLAKGKKQVLMNLVGDKVGEDMIACVDADYDFLMQGATKTSENIVGNPYVFHTYVYAIENFQSYAPSLHDVCVMVTLNDHQIFDFEEYLRQYSLAIFPLFVWSIWYYRTPDYTDFSISDFNRTIETGHFSMQNAANAISNLRHKVGRKVVQLQRMNPDAKESYLALKEELKQLGVTPETTYLYVQGHHLYDNVTVPMLSKVCDKLRRERETEIYHKAVHNTQMRNELSCYEHSIESVASMLKKNTGYMRSPQYQWLKADLAYYMKHRSDRIVPEAPADSPVTKDQPQTTSAQATENSPALSTVSTPVTESVVEENPKAVPGNVAAEQPTSEMVKNDSRSADAVSSTASDASQDAESESEAKKESIRDVKKRLKKRLAKEQEKGEKKT